MAKGADYRIKKIEKGPLQRFKNQNLLIKKFGEVGLQLYKAITGKRTAKELKQDLGIDPALFDQVLSYMQDAGMVELEPVVEGKPPKEKPPAAPEEVIEEIAPPEVPPEEELPPEEEIPPEKELPTLEELPPEEEEEEIRPLEEEIKPIELEEKAEEEIKPEKEEIELEEVAPIEEEAPPKEEEIELEEVAPIEEEAPPKEEEEELEEEIAPYEEIEIGAPEEELPPEEPGISPVEKIISDKYGDLGIRVYALIDGQRTAEEIMSETGVTEAKLVEILDFMDEQGIIKLDYPKGAEREAPPPRAPTPPIGGRTAMAPPPAAKEKKEEVGFVPMIEGEERLKEAKAVPSPLEIPVKAPLDIVKSVQMKAKIMLKLGEKGSKVLELIDGKSDLIDIALELDVPLYEVAGILRFMLENGMIIMKAMSRSDVQKKYGDDGYSVYKVYGKEGLMLYELIGKELTIKQMADKITEDRAQIIDMFIFIHKVLGIELPIDKEMLAKQLGI